MIRETNCITLKPRCMKPTKFTTGRMLLVLLIIALAIGLVSWDQKKSPGHFGQSVNDTVPKTKPGDREKKIRDLDDVLDELNEADMKVNMEKIQKEIADAMKQIDGNKIKMEIEKAMREVDMDRIKKEVETSVAKAMKEIDMVKIQQEVQESLAKVDWDKMKAEMDKVRDID